MRNLVERVLVIVGGVDMAVRCLDRRARSEGWYKTMICQGWLSQNSRFRVSWRPLFTNIVPLFTALVQGSLETPLSETSTGGTLTLKSCSLAIRSGGTRNRKYKLSVLKSIQNLEYLVEELSLFNFMDPVLFYWHIWFMVFGNINTILDCRYWLCKRLAEEESQPAHTRGHQFWNQTSKRVFVRIIAMTSRFYS